MANVRKRSISLTPDLDDAIQRRIASGRYASQSEVIRAALRVLAFGAARTSAVATDGEIEVMRAPADDRLGCCRREPDSARPQIPVQRTGPAPELSPTAPAGRQSSEKPAK